LPNVPPRVHQGVLSLRFNSLIVVMLGVESEALPPYTALYVPDPAFPFHRLSFPTGFTGQGAPAGHMAVAAELTTNPGDGAHELADEQVIQYVVDGLTAMKLIDPARIRFRRVYRTKHAYVVRTFDYAQKLKDGLAYLNQLGIVSVGRNAEFEYINMDEAIRRALEV